MSGRESRRAKGRAKWKTRRRTATACQPPLARSRYQGISSGRFADQMIRNCENERYAQTMVKANSRYRVPMSLWLVAKTQRRQPVGAWWSSWA